MPDLIHLALLPYYNDIFAIGDATAAAGSELDVTTPASHVLRKGLQETGERWTSAGLDPVADTWVQITRTADLLPLSALQAIRTSLTAEAQWRIRGDASSLPGFERGLPTSDAYHTPPPATPVYSQIDDAATDPTSVSTSVTFAPGESWLGLMSAASGNIRTGDGMQVFSVRGRSQGSGGEVTVKLYELVGGTTPTFREDLGGKPLKISSGSLTAANTSVVSFPWNADKLTDPPAPDPLQRLGNEVMVEVSNTGTDSIDICAVDVIYDVYGSGVSAADSGWLDIHYPVTHTTIKGGCARTLSHLFTLTGETADVYYLPYWRVDFRDYDNPDGYVSVGGLYAGAVWASEPTIDLGLTYRNSTRTVEGRSTSVRWAGASGHCYRVLKLRVTGQRASIYGDLLELLARCPAGSRIGAICLAGYVDSEQCITPPDVNIYSVFGSNESSDFTLSAVGLQVDPVDVVEFTITEYE
jgi:hypothetical protein